MAYRTDTNNNPTAFTTDVAKEADLTYGVDYVQGDPFDVHVPGTTPHTETYYTAKLLGDALAVTMRVINAIGFYTKAGQPRWSYIAIPYQVWVNILDNATKTAIIGGMYRREGGVTLSHYFPGVINF